MQCVIRIFALTVASFLAVSSAIAEPLKPLTLKSAFSAALTKSETYLASKEKVEEAKGRKLQALGTALPKVTGLGEETIQDTETVQNNNGNEVSQTFTRRSTPEAKLNFTQPIFQGFREFQAIQVSKSEQKQNAHLANRQKELLFYDVAKTYYTILELEGELAVANRMVSTLQSRSKDLTGRVELGKSRNSDVLNTDSRVNRAQAIAEEVRGNLAKAREFMAFLTGNPLNQPLVDEFKVPNPPQPLSFYLAQLDSRPDLLAQNETTRLANARVAYEKGGLLPRVDAEANYYLYRVGFLQDIDWDVVFSLKVPLFQGGDTLGKIKEAKSIRRQQIYSQQGARRLAETEVAQNYQALLSILEEARLYKQAATKLRSSYNLNTEDYKRGLINNLEVLDSMEEWFNAETEAVRSYFETKLAYLDLRTAAGNLPFDQF